MITSLFRNAAIYTPASSQTPLSGDNQGKVDSIARGALLCRNGLIEKIGEEHAVIKDLSLYDVDIEIDCEGCCLIPGFVDLTPTSVSPPDGKGSSLSVLPALHTSTSLGLEVEFFLLSELSRRQVKKNFSDNP